MATRSRWFHKSCFSCSCCQHSLELSSFLEGPGQEVFCRTCYSRTVATGGRSRYGEKPEVMCSGGREKEGCLRCGTKVFLMDMVRARGRLLHRQCLSCSTCGTGLSPGNFSCGEDGEIYCRNCYSSSFGVVGRAGSVPPASTIQALPDDPSMCPRCGGKVFQAEKVATSVGPFHRSCYRCVDCQANLSQKSCSAGPDGEIYCSSCYQEQFGTMSRRPRSRATSRAASRASSRPRSRTDSLAPDLDSEEGHRVLAAALTNTTSIRAVEGARDGCLRCGGRVFEAEKMVTDRGVFHRFGTAQQEGITCLSRPPGCASSAPPATVCCPTPAMPSSARPASSTAPAVTPGPRALRPSGARPPRPGSTRR